LRAKIILFPYIIYKDDKKLQEFVTLRKVFRGETKEKKQIRTNYPQIYLIPVIVVNKNKNNTPTSMCAYSTCKM
jgi:hypothetical protein